MKGVYERKSKYRDAVEHVAKAWNLPVEEAKRVVDLALKRGRTDLRYLEILVKRVQRFFNETHCDQECAMPTHTKSKTCMVGDNYALWDLNYKGTGRR